MLHYRTRDTESLVKKRCEVNVINSPRRDSGLN